MASGPAKGKALVAKLRSDPKTRDAEALAGWIGRYKKARKAGKSVAEAKQVAKGKKIASGGEKVPKDRKESSAPSKVPNPSERFEDLPGDVTEKQGAYLRSLIEKNSPLDAHPNSVSGEPQLLGGADDIGEYAILVNLPTPKNKAEASKMIDALKSGGPKGYARDNREWFAGLAAKLAKRHGNDLSGVKKEAAKRYLALPTQERIRMQDDRKAYRREIINPLLKA